MDQKQKVVLKYIEKGNLLTPEALDFLINNKTDEKSFDTLIVDKDMLEEQTNDFKIIKNFVQKPTEIKKEDFIKFYASKFEKMSGIIVNRLQKDFVSMNKISSLKNEVYIIGMIREATQKNDKQFLEIEDMTDTKTVVFDKEQDIEIDDVVAIKAISSGESLFGNAVLFPDIPLRQPSKGIGKGCFISDLHLDEVPIRDAEKFFSWFSSTDIKNLFVAGDLGDNDTFEKLVKEYCDYKMIFCIPGNNKRRDDFGYPTIGETFTRKNIISLSNPAILEVNGLVILMIHDGNINMLKKRYLGKSKLILNEDYLVLDTVPDIMHCGHSHKPEINNYKSVSIVNSGSLLAEFKPVVIDFRTREVNQITSF